MDEIANSSAIGSLPVRSKDLQNWLLASQDTGNDGEKVGRLLARILTKDTRLVAANWVEVTEGSDGPSGVGVGDIREDSLAHPLGAAIGRGEAVAAGLDGLLFARLFGVALDLVDAVLLAERNTLVGERTVDSGRGREDKVGDAKLPKDLEEIDHARDIVLVVVERLVNGLLDRLVGGEVDDTGNLGNLAVRIWDVLLVFGEDVAHLRAAVIGLVELDGGSGLLLGLTVLLGQELDALEHAVPRVAQVIDNNDVVTLLEQL